MGGVSPTTARDHTRPAARARDGQNTAAARLPGQGALATAPWLRLLPRAPSDPPPPLAAPAVGVPLDVLLVTLQRPVLRHAHLLRRRIEALAGVGGLLHLCRKVGHEGKLLAPCPAACRAGRRVPDRRGSGGPISAPACA